MVNWRTTEKIEKLKQVRNGHRTAAKKKVNTAREFMQNYDPANLELQGKLKAICHYISLKEIKEIVKKIDSQILDKTEKDSAINKEIEETTDFKEYIQEYIVMIDLTTTKGELEKLDAATGNQNTSPPAQNNQSESQASKEASIKLPKIQLQDFYGNPLDYPAFWDAFESTINANPQLITVNKFNYLKGMLKGQAEAAISGLKITADKYKIALDILQSRFGNTDVIISAHMKKLVGMPGVASSSDIRKIRQMFDFLERTVRHLQNLGITSSQYGCLLTPVVLKKIPQNNKLAILHNTEQTEKFDLESLMEKFKKELEAREKITFLSGSTAIECSNSAKYTRSQQPATASALFTSERGTPYCVYCTQQHQSTKCRVVTNIDARKAILRKKGKCFSCVRSGQLAKNCPSKIKCYHCSKTHHPSICDSLKKNRVELSSATPPIIPPASDKIEQVQSQQEQSIIREADERMLSESSGVRDLPNVLNL